MLVFRQLFDDESSTFTYLLGESEQKECLLIDPVKEKSERDLKLIGELGLKLTSVLDTHCHADHITGAWSLAKDTGALIGISTASRVEGADLHLKEGDKIWFGRRAVEARTTPGHTSGCLTYVIDDLSMAFTGDALLIRGCGRTDFQGGNPEVLYRSIHSKIFELPDDTKVFPGHDYNGLSHSTVGEEKLCNKRLGQEVSEKEFCSIMNNLRLGFPKKMNQVLPLNLKCGAPIVLNETVLGISLNHDLYAELGYTDGGGI